MLKFYVIEGQAYGADVDYPDTDPPMDNAVIVSALEGLGFSNVVVTGDTPDNKRSLTCLWPLPTTSLSMPEATFHIKNWHKVV